MPSRFDRAGAVAARAVTRLFGEALRHRPQREAGRSGGAGGDDPGRTAAAFTGSVARAGITIRRQGAGAKGASNLPVVTGQWEVWIDAPEALRLAIRAGDLVERLDPPPGEPGLFRLSAAQPVDGGVVHPADPA